MRILSALFAEFMVCRKDIYAAYFCFQIRLYFDTSTYLQSTCKHFLGKYARIWTSLLVLAFVSWKSAILFSFHWTFCNSAVFSKQVLQTTKTTGRDRLLKMWAFNNFLMKCNEPYKHGLLSLVRRHGGGK